MRSNALDREDPQVQFLDFARSSCNGYEICAKLGINFPSLLAIPRNLLNSVVLVGVLIFTIASVLAGSVWILFASMTWLRNVSTVLLNSYLGGLSFPLVSWIRLMTASRCWFS